MHRYVCTYVDDICIYVHTQYNMYEHNDMYHEVLKTDDT